MIETVSMLTRISLNKHTAGPWDVVIDERYDFQFSKSYINGYDIKNANGYIVGCEGISGDSEEIKANAQLIACAPDLLDDLCVAAELLRKYELLHRAKNTEESTAKAEVNAELACRFEMTISKARGEA